ncbi:MBL fold metallo-hydrolase [Lactococcus lactis subsp. lactis]|uniref:MBL fold metallo-hydrolase n=1 Tax=Lactococcus lactis TaxID=1358 RepID=UPI00223A92CD|nr:MBL fold metallo-hydrolase [Lactococcus lactis]MCT0017728.1 MBL fold metallo-hydrolase [Lactococcus lactis subsp. lactis]
MPNGIKSITNRKVYYCGYCTNQLQYVFKGIKKEQRKFPAGCLLFQHDGEYYLYDTGYAPRVLENGWYSKIYNLFNPTTCPQNEALIVQLAKDGIQASDIKGIIISHLHPDHIGGLRDFPKAKIYLSRKSFETYKYPKLLDLIFINLFPNDFENRVKILETINNVDFFGDGSLILKDISGHTAGQIGLIFPFDKIFYAADSSWGEDLIDKKMKKKAQLIQNDYQLYKENIVQVKKEQKKGIDIIFSHDRIPYD